jgi:hypothetical protein
MATDKSYQINDEQQKSLIDMFENLQVKVKHDLFITMKEQIISAHKKGYNEKEIAENISKLIDPKVTPKSIKTKLTEWGTILPVEKTTASTPKAKTTIKAPTEQPNETPAGEEGQQ